MTAPDSTNAATVERTNQVQNSLESQIDSLRRIGAEFHRRKWSLGTSSNYSVVLSRSPLELLVTASGKDKGNLQSTDFVRVNQHGNPTVPNQPRSSAETLIHVVLAEQEDVGAILHTHSVWGTVLSDHHFNAGGFLIEGYEMLKGLEGIRTHETSYWVPIFDNTQDIPVLAEQIRTALLDASAPLEHGFLIRGHGLYTWGKDLFAARRHIEIFEFLFECVAQQALLRGVARLP